MTIRTGPNAPLGIPAFDVALDDTTEGSLRRVTASLGTIINGFDDSTGTNSEYILLKSGADTAADAGVGYDPDTFVTTAGGTTATAVIATTANQVSWYKLAARQPPAA